MVDIDDEPSDDNRRAERAQPAGAGTPVIDSPVIKLVNFVKGIMGSGNKSPASPAELPVVKNTTALQKKSEVAAAPTAASVSAAGPLMTVVVRNEFYRDGFRSVLKIAIAEAIIIVALILTFIAYMNATKAQDHYFATTADGRIMQLVPMNVPNMGTSALLSWAAQSATEVMTFGFHDYQRRMQQSSRHFTSYGWESFTSALQKSRIIESVEALQQVVTAQPRSAPILIQEGVFNGKYRWVVDLPLTVTYQAGSSSRTDLLTIRMVIDRVPSLENPNGVGIEQWIATQS